MIDILSCPHSGTRSLKKISRIGTHQHFGRIVTVPERALVPLRNPARIAMRWKVDSLHGRALPAIDPFLASWHHCWRAMEATTFRDVFFFPFDAGPLPFEALEQWLGRPVKRYTGRRGSLTPATATPEQLLHDEDWRILEEIMQLPIARKYYGDTHGV